MPCRKPHGHYPPLLLLAITLLLTACASPAPDAIRIAPEREIAIRSVQQAPKGYIGRPVRWGGDIISIENRANETWIEVLARPLDSAGEPAPEAASTGRFLARISRFLDPVVYAPGRKITVRGIVESTIVRRIGQHPYRFPLVRVQVYYLWPEPLENDASWRDPLWYDPWYPHPYGYDPFYGPYAPYYWDPWFSRGYRH